MDDTRWTEEQKETDSGVVGRVHRGKKGQDRTGEVK